MCPKGLVGWLTPSSRCFSAFSTLGVRPADKSQAGIQEISAVVSRPCEICLPYGTLRIQINPDVEMTLSSKGRVIYRESIAKVKGIYKKYHVE